MTSNAEMARERKKARSLYLELGALGLELYAKEDPQDVTGYKKESPAHIRYRTPTLSG